MVGKIVLSIKHRGMGMMQQQQQQQLQQQQQQQQQQHQHPAQQPGGWQPQPGRLIIVKGLVPIQ